MLLLHAQSAAECEPAHSTQLRAVRVFVHFPLLARPQRRQRRQRHRRCAPPRYQRRDRRADGHVFLPAAGLPRACSAHSNRCAAARRRADADRRPRQRRAAPAALRRVRLLVQDAAACAASSYGSTPNDSLLPELELIIGCIVALSRMLWQLKDSDVDASLLLLNTMLGVCAPAHTAMQCTGAARERHAAAVLHLPPRQQRAAVRPVCCCPTRCSGVRSSCRSVLP